MQPPRVTLLVWEAAALGVLHGKARRQFFFLAELLEALGKFKATSGSCLNKSLPGPQSDRAVLWHSIGPIVFTKCKYQISDPFLLDSHARSMGFNARSGTWRLYYPRCWVREWHILSVPGSWSVRIQPRLQGGLMNAASPLPHAGGARSLLNDLSVQTERKVGRQGCLGALGCLDLSFLTRNRAKRKFCNKFLIVCQPVHIVKKNFLNKMWVLFRMIWYS